MLKQEIADARLDVDGMEIKPLADQVCIEPIEDQVSKGGIILVKVEAAHIPSSRGRVIAVGPGKMESGHFVATTVKKGQLVCFHLFPSGVDIHQNGKKYIVIQERQIVAVLA